MNGINAETGKRLSGLDHLRQSIRDILATPKGSRVMRREYGSDLFKIIDRPVNDFFPIEVFRASGEALSRWEPRLELTRVRLESAEQGRVVIGIEGRHRPDGKWMDLEGIVV